MIASPSSMVVAAVDFLAVWAIAPLESPIIKAHPATNNALVETDMNISFALSQAGG
jgi:hypothetical protein